MGRDYSPILSGASERNFLGCFTGMKAKRRTKCLKLKAKCQLRSCSSCRGTKAAFEREAVVKPESGMYLIHRSVRFYDCCVAVAHHTERSLRSSAAATKTAQYTRTKQAGRSAASGCSAFDLPALPGGREEVLWSGPTGMDAGRAVMGHGWPVTAGPRNRTGAREPERSEGRTKGRGPFGSFWVLPKGTRCKSETNISVI